MAADLGMMNMEQQAAILESMDCNVALLAGAGSGKTATLVKRTEYLIDDMGVKPENIMLITFTNKAAKEIVERVANVCPDAYKMMIGTFHGICVRIMRKLGHHLGINNFSIADDKDSKKMIKAICEGQNKEYSKQMIADIKKKISFYKSSLIKPAKVLSDYCSENKESYSFASIYQDYQNQCWKEKTFDFDDLIIYTVLLISSFPEVKKWMEDNIKYIMVDETQDTSTDQFQLIKLIAGENNLMLFGDINQSIYGFRNAKPEYLDSFCKMYPNSKLLKLSINYRSTKTIISAANSVINFNSFGEKVIMTTDNEVGEKIGMKHFSGFNSNTDVAEARWIASEMVSLVNMKKNTFEDFAIIYRTNMQSNELEKVFVQNGIPYTIIGSSSYWASKEMKDILSFCKMILNPYDVASFKRVLSTVRGVGKSTQGRIIDYMNANNLTTHEVLSSISFYSPESYKGVSAHAQTELAKIDMMFSNGFQQCSDIADYVINSTAYAEDLRLSNSEEARQSLEIVEDSINSFQQFEKNGDSPESVIDQVSLMSDAKGDKKKELNVVKLLSGHACKGLEFNTVFVAGAEEGLFPHWNAINSVDKVKSIEEERRLFYVAITRAKKKLYLTSCARRKDTTTTPSRFIKEIPSILIEECF